MMMILCVAFVLLLGPGGEEEGWVAGTVDPFLTIPSPYNPVQKGPSVFDTCFSPGDNLAPGWRETVAGNYQYPFAGKVVAWYSPRTGEFRRAVAYDAQGAVFGEPEQPPWPHDP
jgi:hypothetical protein